MRMTEYLRLCITVCLPMLMLLACDVHQWPENPEFVKVQLRLNYETEMTEWEYLYDGSQVIEQGFGQRYNNQQNYGKIRYIVRTYPLSSKQRALQDYTQEFIFTKDVSGGYNHEVTLDMLPGNYNVMVWSDLVWPDFAPTENGTSFYNADNFAEITLQGTHTGNTNYRDAFRGSGNISLEADIIDHLHATLDVTMQRPLAKFEFVTNDVEEFIDKEYTRVKSKANSNDADADADSPTKAINLEDYKVVFYYVGFMPDAYSMFTDKPVDSSTGVMFESTLKKLSESYASMGFDYVFVNGKQSAVTVQIGIFDNEQTLLSLSDPMEVPLMRNHHTIMTGMFLMSEASGGVLINPDFDGDHNLIFR